MIRFQFGADTKELDEKSDNSSKTLDNLAKQARETGNRIAKMGIASAGAALGGIAVLATQTMSAVTSQDKLIMAAKGSARELEKMRAAAKQASQGLSNMDVNAIRNASIAVSDVRKQTDALKAQYAAQLAPVIQAMAARFFDVSQEASGMGDMAQQAFDYTIKGAKFVANAIDGIGRTFNLSVEAIKAGASFIVQKLSEAALKILEIADKIPGVDFSKQIASVKEFAQAMDEGVNQSLEKMQDIAMAEMAGDQLEAFVKAAQQRVDYSRKYSDEEIAIIQDRVQELRDIAKSEIDLLHEKHGEEMEILQEALAAKQISQEEYDAMRIASEKRLQDELTRIEKEATKARLKLVEVAIQEREQEMRTMMGNLSTLMNSESRKMFEIGKAAAIADTAVNTRKAAMSAYSAMAGIPVVGPALGAAAAAAAIASGAVQIQNIRKQSMKGGGGGVSSGGMSNTQAVNASSEPVLQRNIGISIEGESVSKDQVRSLIGAINTELGDNVKMGVA